MSLVVKGLNREMINFLAPCLSSEQFEIVEIYDSLWIIIRGLTRFERTNHLAVKVKRRLI